MVPALTLELPGTPFAGPDTGRLFFGDSIQDKNMIVRNAKSYGRCV